MRFNFTTSGVCSKKIIFDLEDGVIKFLKFIGGCPGNLLALSVLLKNKPAREAASLLEGLPCGQNSTSCSDQLSKALFMALEHEEKLKAEKKDDSGESPEPVEEKAPEAARPESDRVEEG
jgi:uncharacterized protein (TIGR03905 family)